MAEKCADDNFVLEQMLNKSEYKLKYLESKRLNSTQIHRGLTENLCMRCDHTGKMDVFIQIRQDFSLKLRNKIWKITNEDIPTPFARRRVSELLWFVNREAPIISRAKHSAKYQFHRPYCIRSYEEEWDGKIAVLFGRSVAHDGKEIEDNCLRNEDVYVHLWDAVLAETENEMKKCINKAYLNSLANKGVND